MLLFLLYSLRKASELVKNNKNLIFLFLFLIVVLFLIFFPISTSSITFYYEVLTKNKKLYTQGTFWVAYLIIKSDCLKTFDFQCLSVCPSFCFSVLFVCKCFESVSGLSLNILTTFFSLLKIYILCNMKKYLCICWMLLFAEKK